MSYTMICKYRLMEACSKGIRNIQNRRQKDRESRIEDVLRDSQSKKWPFNMLAPKTRSEAIKKLDKDYFNSDWHFIFLYGANSEEALSRLQSLARCADDHVMLSSEDAVHVDGYL